MTAGSGRKPGKPGKDKEGEELWALVVRDVKPLKKAKKKDVLLPAPARFGSVRKRAESHKPAPPPSAPKEKFPPALDRRTEEKLRRGKMEIDRTIDLHGYTYDQALSCLRRQLQKAQDQGQRCALVITGKGRGGSEGILRRSLPEWLSEPPLSAMVLRCVPAKPQHGGAGAFYVLLRRVR